jgi:hypothetical protein
MLAALKSQEGRSSFTELPPETQEWNLQICDALDKLRRSSKKSLQCIETRIICIAGLYSFSQSPKCVFPPNSIPLSTISSDFLENLS